METKYKFNPELVLTIAQRQHLSMMYHTEGYKVLHLLLRSLVDKYMVDIINVPVEREEEILAKHKVLKTAGQIYSDMTEWINYEVSQHTSALKEDNNPFDMTEDVLDIGPRASTVEELEAELRAERSVFEEGLLDGE